MEIFRKTVHPFFPWVCGMRVHKKVRIHFEKLQNLSKNRKLIFLIKFSSGSPDPFEVFGINCNELPDIPEEPPLPVIPPPKKRLSLKSISKKRAQGEQPSTSRGGVTVAKSGSSSRTRFVPNTNCQDFNIFRIHLKGYCSLCILDQKSRSVKALSDQVIKIAP